MVIMRPYNRGVKPNDQASDEEWAGWIGYGLTRPGVGGEGSRAAELGSYVGMCRQTANS